MAIVFSAVHSGANTDYWDGTIAWGYDATSDIRNPTAHPNQGARDAQYTADYTSIDAWEQGRDGVAQSADTEVAVIQGPWDDGDDTADFTIAFTNTPTIIIRAIGDARHSGKWEDGAGTPYRLVAAVAASSGVIVISESDVTIDGIQTHNTAEDTSNAVIYSPTAVTGVRISNNIIRSEFAEGVRLNQAGIQAILRNNVIYCADGDGQEGLWVDSVDTCGLYNNTVDGFNQGCEVDAVNTSCTMKNCAIFNSPTEDLNDAVGITTNKNASDDAFGTNPVTLDSTNNYQDEFTDMANNDYSVKDNGSELYDAGEADVFAEDDDIIGTSRPQGSAWDIGAFELIVGGAAIFASISDGLGISDTITTETGHIRTIPDGL